MKTLSIALAAMIAAAAPALAQSAKVPTGIDVKGETHYYLDSDKRVVQVKCDTTRALLDKRIMAACGSATERGDRFSIDKRSGAKE